MDSYKTIETKLANRQPFTGNSLKGYWEGNTYRVISYNTLIATLEEQGYTVTSEVNEDSTTTLTISWRSS